MYKQLGAGGCSLRMAKARKIDSARNTGNLQNRIEMGFEKGFCAQIKNLTQDRLMSAVPQWGNKVLNFRSCY